MSKKKRIKMAYFRGRQDKVRGKRRSDNPYKAPDRFDGLDPGDPEYSQFEAWDDGWLAKHTEICLPS